MKQTIIGIDLGTSNCCISYITDNGQMEIILDDFAPNSITIPSIVSIDNEGILVGNEINKIHINSNKNIFHSFKRLIGHNLNDIETTNLKKILNYSIDENDGKIFCIDTNNKKYHLEEIIYFLLKKIKSIIVNKFTNDGWSCIITIPAYFNEIQRQVTLNAIQLAELPLIKLLNEPTAASFAYLYHNKVLYEETFDKKILVIDFGAGTLDLTIIEIIKANELICEVLGIYGDNNFGGIDITQLIYNNLFSDISSNLIDINTKLQIAENIKIELSSQLDVKYYSNELERTFNYKYSIFNSELEKKFSNKILFTIEQVLSNAKLNKSNIDEIILVGGSFKIPYFRDLVSNYFNKHIDKISLKLNNQTFLLYEDIAVSLGASVYGYFNSTNQDIVLIEKLPLSIGIESADGQIIKIIERNTNIPISRTKTFTTETIDQNTVTISIYQGESVFKENCCLIGTFILKDLPPNRPVIFVTIRVDSNGIIFVTAKDKRSYTESTIKIDAKSSKLSQEEIDELLKKYEINKVSEIQYKKLINNYYQLINIIDKISYQINFSFELDYTLKQIIIDDITKVINVMCNSYIICKYKININLLNKCAIINDINFNLENKIQIMSQDEIDEYIDVLQKLHDFLIDKYDIFIIQNNGNILSANEIIKLETITDEIIIDENIINTNIKSTSIKELNKLPEINEFTKTNEINESNEIINTYTKDDLINLIEYLKLNISDFELTIEGEKYLLDKLFNIDLENIFDIEKSINDINIFCIDIKNKFTE
jgi:molecular chaperone DnaK (HSP70)